MTGSGGKRERQAAILEVVREHRVSSQEALRELLVERGIEVTQATLSRDVRDLRLVKVADAEGVPHYTLPDEWEHTPPLELLLPQLFVSADGTGNLLLVRTLTGAAPTVASAIDWEEWSEVVGTIAGDDTILIVLRDEESLDAVQERIEQIASS